MKQPTYPPEIILRRLEGGLILRRATPQDAEALATFNARIHSDDGPDKPDERVAAWTQDLLTRPHPTFSPGDFTIVEDTQDGKIVSTLNLISQTWSYAGIPFKVGRPEIVGTLPEYRNRGLVRQQFEVIHEWSAKRGELAQGITGIPYYYRLFGYEMGLGLGGGRLGYAPHVPKLKEGQEDSYRVRPAGEADLPFIAEVYQNGSRRYVVSCLRDETLWRYELSGKSEKNLNRYELRIVESINGEQVGFLAHSDSTWGPCMVATIYEVAAGYSWAEITPTVVRYLFAVGKEYALRDGKEAEFAAFGFWLGNEHPVYQVLHDALPRIRKPYAWYVRVPDLAGFLEHIAPALEQRLAASTVVGHSGELKLTFYRRGLRLAFEKGRLVKVDAWQPEPNAHPGDAAFPELTFLQLLFGYRSLDELRYAFADCMCDNDLAYALLNVLFPKQASDIWPIS